MSTEMKKIASKEVQRLRAETNAGVMDAKRALEDTQGDYEKAKGLLKERGLARVAKKSDREAKEGAIASYIHAGGRVGALVEIASETDFVARSDEFQKLALEVAMQVAAMAPAHARAAVAAVTPPADIDELLAQSYIREPSKTIEDLVTTLAAAVGENVSVRRIQRFALGEA